MRMISAQTCSAFVARENRCTLLRIMRQARTRAIMDRPTTAREKAKITAGAVAALVIVGWMAILAIAVLAAR
jgi:hypothetical protein